MHLYASRLFSPRYSEAMFSERAVVYLQVILQEEEGADIFHRRPFLFCRLQ